MFTAVDWVWGIHLPRSVQVGRRVRIWHNGCMVLSARAIGNDVHIRHDTTFGPAPRLRATRHARAPLEELPVIEDRADIGSGVCVLGAVTVGHDAMVGRQLGGDEERAAASDGAGRAGEDRPGMIARAQTPGHGHRRIEQTPGSSPSRTASRCAMGMRNENPHGIGFWQLLREDFRTHGRSLRAPAASGRSRCIASVTRAWASGPSRCARR